MWRGGCGTWLGAVVALLALLSLLSLEPLSEELSFEPLEPEGVAFEPLAPEGVAFEPLAPEGVSFVEESPVPEPDDVSVCSVFFSVVCSDFLPAALDPWSFL